MDGTQKNRFSFETKISLLDYHLFNPGTHLKGEIIAVWERTFKVLGTMYVPYQKHTSETRNDDEWEDEIGRMKIDIPADVKEWRGRITCRFTVKREEPQYYKGEGKWNGYCGPKVHLYYIPEGTNERIFLTGEADHKLVTKDDKFGNAIYIYPLRWE